ncbi:YczE/YyaS/YitT family protein [Enterococcus sp. LJL51]|uniref:YczE/YyaS/YitT family protein n=1 Tax=Enterococcus sp. LJL51 TaxID=3416656 RepID=UPI003CF576F7
MIKRKPVYRILSVFAGTALTALSISVLLKAGYGVDVLSVFLTGIQKYIPWEFGYLSMSFNVLMIVIAFFMQRELIGAGTIINGVCLGLMVNFFSGLLADWEMGIPLLWGLVAAICYAVGIGLYVSAQMGAAAIECLSFMIESRTKGSLKLIRIAIDAVLVVSGLLLGSTSFHIATFVCLLTTGPIVEWMLKRSMRTNERP